MCPTSPRTRVRSRRLPGDSGRRLVKVRLHTWLSGDAADPPWATWAGRARGEVSGEAVSLHLVGYVRTRDFWGLLDTMEALRHPCSPRQTASTGEGLLNTNGRGQTGSGKEEAASGTRSSRLSGMCGRACWCPEVCIPLTPHQRNPPWTSCHTGAPTVGTRGARTNGRWAQRQFSETKRKPQITHTPNKCWLSPPFSPPCPNIGRSCCQRRKGVLWEGSHFPPLQGVSLTWVPSASRPAGTWGSEGCALAICNFISMYPGLLTNKLPDRWWHLPRCQ